MVNVNDLVLELVAENPGISVEEFFEIATDQGLDENRVGDLLEQSVERGDVLRFDGRHWVVRKGRFAFTEYDHPQT